ncbi:MAG: cyclic nucleotide-binding domain-containing protein, partial [Anaerolineales bacterium]|nr:cyclic nucleotide-binding domain-containing protein [Anaerolineales bacterium]
VHLAAISALIGVARQLPGSRFQWAIWALAAAPLVLTLAWLAADAPLWHDWLLVAASTAVLASGIVSWYTVGPKWLSTGDRVVMGIMIIVGPLYYLGMSVLVGDDVLLQNGRWLTTALILFGIFFGLMFMSPLLINFRRSRFVLPWMLFVLAILATPWLQFFPNLHPAVTAIWLYAALLYLVLGAMAQFERFDEADAEAIDVYDERARLVDGYNQFLQAFFRSYEAIFGGRRLLVIQQQMAALGALDQDASILQIAERAQQALLLAVDRLDDLAGTPFTKQAGQAAYDSLPWLHAETLVRHVLSGMEWGSQLAQGFIQARDRRAQLIRRADIFAGFDEEATHSTLAIARSWIGRSGVTMAHAGAEAVAFYLIEFGTVGIFHEGMQVGTLHTGDYFGTMALLDRGPYQFTYRTLTKVTALTIDRDKFDPLLRADTTLAHQVSSGARERQLLREMPLFSSLSPQDLAAVDRRLTHQSASAGEIVVAEGTPRSHLYIIAEGVVEVLSEDEGGRNVVIGRLGPGEHFGEYALFADTAYQASYRAAVDTELLLLDEPKFDELVARSDRMLHYVEQIGSGRLIATRRRLGPSALIS